MLPISHYKMQASTHQGLEMYHSPVGLITKIRINHQHSYIPQTVPHLSANRSPPASLFLSYSVLSATSSATSLPHTLSTHAKIISIPAATPELVQIFPSTTHRALATHFTFPFCCLTHVKAFLLDVARRPSRTPDLARMAEPVQTVRR